MERPSKLSGDQGKYIEYLESKLEKFSAKKTKIRSLLGLKKLVDDTNAIMINGFTIADPDGVEHHVDLMNTASLSDKDDKIFDKIYKVIDKLDTYIDKMEKWEEEVSEDEINHEAEMIKGEFSVENIAMNG